MSIHDRAVWSDVKQGAFATKFAAAFCKVFARRRACGGLNIVGERTHASSLALALEEELAGHMLRVCARCQPRHPAPASITTCSSTCPLSRSLSARSVLTLVLGRACSRAVSHARAECSLSISSSHGHRHSRAIPVAITVHPARSIGDGVNRLALLQLRALLTGALRLGIRLHVESAGQLHMQK